MDLWGFGGAMRAVQSRLLASGGLIGRRAENPGMNNKKAEPPPIWADDMHNWIDYLTAGGLSPDTLRCRRYKLTRLARDLPDGPRKVTGEQIVRLFASHDWKPETRKAYRNTLSSFFQWLTRTGRRGDDPMQDVPKVRKPHAHPRPCLDRHIVAAMQQATPTERVMLRLAAECGLRRSEIARLHSDDVMADLVGKSLVIRGKGDRQRLVPCPDDLADIVAGAAGYVFPGRWDGHVEASYVSRHISNLLPDGWGPHSLRHRYATVTYAATHDLILVSQLLGHASVETTQVYVALPSERLREGMEAVRLAV